MLAHSAAPEALLLLVIGATSDCRFKKTE